MITYSEFKRVLRSGGSIRREDLLELESWMASKLRAIAKDRSISQSYISRGRNPPLRVDYYRLCIERGVTIC